MPTKDKLTEVADEKKTTTKKVENKTVKKPTRKGNEVETSKKDTAETKPQITKGKQPITKKKLWIIITSVLCVAVLLTVSIAAIITATRRRLDMTPTSVITYNNHTKLRVVSPANNVSIYNNSNPTYYSNGTVLVVNEDTDTYGIYSYVRDHQVISTDYEFSKITPINLQCNGVNTGDTIFKLGNKFGEISNKITFHNDDGLDLKITEYDSEKEENYVYIKQRKLNTNEKRKGVKVTTKNRYTNEKVYVSNVNYSTSYIVEGKYNYEVWTITTTDGKTYQNFYKVEDKQRELIQTNNLLGNSVELSDTELQMTILKNNEPAFYTISERASLNGEPLLNLTAYDINLNNIGSVDISTEHISSIVPVGNKMFIQFKTPCSEDDYDYAEVQENYSSTTTTYYQLETYSFNLKTGNYKKEKFKYLITDFNNSFNSETVLITARKIKDKTLQDSQLLLVNDYLKTKEIGYEIDTIAQISKDRYLVENTQGQYLIDSNYNLIAYLGNYDNYFTTGNAIMLSKTATGYTYVCSLDGIVVKQYFTNKIKNVYNEKYYMVETTTKKEDGTYTEYYLETLGVRQGTPLVSQKQDSETYTYNGVEYVGYNDQILADGVSIITRIRKNGETYTYEFYNIEGKKLLELNNFVSTNRVLNYWGYSDDGNILLYISTNVGGIGYTLMVDR